MIVCEKCLTAIESHEGSQTQKKIDYWSWDEYSKGNDEIKCEWCEENFDSDMYEI